MGTLSGLFDLSRGALASDQAALNATANNVANQNTAGYVRQVVRWSSGDTVTLSNGSSSTSGPAVSLTSQRDRVLEQRLHLATQMQAGSAARAASLGQMEDVFSVAATGANTAGTTQIGNALDALFSSFTALAANPSDAGTRAGVLGAANTLAATFRSASQQLQQVGTSLQGDIAGAIPAVNSLTATIARLNGEITSSSPDKDAGTLEDQRQLAIAQLSQYVGLTQISTENNGITLATAGGTLLVEGSNASELTAQSTAGGTLIHDASGADVTSTITDGSIGGQLTAQQVDLPAVTGSLDALAYRLATAVNAQNEAGRDATGAPGGPIFSVSATSAGAAATLAVLPTSGAAIAAANVGEGVSGTGNANALAGLAQLGDAAGVTVSGQLASLLGNLGATSARLQQQSSAHTALVTQLTAQRDGLSAVSLDTEAGNLSQDQRSYEAAAKLFSIVDNIMAAAINLGSQTTVS